jgi:hypothetical protein
MKRMNGSTKRHCDRTVRAGRRARDLRGRAPAGVGDAAAARALGGRGAAQVLLRHRCPRISRTAPSRL